MSSRTIAVYGATGHTGKFVLRELEVRGYPAVAIDRRRAPCDDADALDEALSGSAAVINCAGPFLDTAPALIEAALRAGVHYFDITAEQRSARQSLATYHEEAGQRGIVVVPALAFFGGLPDLLATAITRGADRIESIEIGVALDYWHPTKGTRLTGDRNTARRLVTTHGRLMPIPRPAPVRRWTFPAPFGVQEMEAVPLSEILTISRHIAAQNVCSYMNAAPLRDLSKPGTPPPSSSDPSGRSSQRFVMDVRATLGGGRETRITGTGVDIYAVTAPIVVEACLRVLENPPAKGGAYAPGELFEPESFLSALEPHLKSEKFPTW